MTRRKEQGGRGQTGRKEEGRIEERSREDYTNQGKGLKERRRED